MTEFAYVDVGELFDLNGELFVKTRNFGESFDKKNAFCLESNNLEMRNKTIHISCEAKVHTVRDIYEWNDYNRTKDDIFYVK